MTKSQQAVPGCVGGARQHGEDAGVRMVKGN